MSEPDIIAHRGFSGLYPENTVSAVTAATNGGRHPVPDMVEIDVQPCKGGDIIVFHDEQLQKHGDRGLTDTTGVPWKTPCEDVFSAEVLESGDTVPQLAEVLAAVPDDVGVNIELKDIDSDRVTFEWGEDAEPEIGRKLGEQELEERTEIWADFAAQVMDVASDVENEILISSFFEGAIAAVREVDTVPVAFLLWESIEDGMDVVQRHDCEAVHPPIDMIQGPFFGENIYTDGQFTDIDLVEWAHSSDRNINVWTIETWFQAEKMREAGVDGLISDYPLLVNRQ